MTNKEIEEKIERLHEEQKHFNKEADSLAKENKKLLYTVKQNEVRLKDIHYQISHNMKYRNELINKLPARVKENVKGEKKTKLTVPLGYSIITILNKDI